MSILQCCKGCEKRHPLCHADCPEKAAADAIREEEKKRRQVNIPCYDYARQSKNKRDRRRNLKK